MQLSTINNFSRTNSVQYAHVRRPLSRKAFLLARFSLKYDYCKLMLSCENITVVRGMQLFTALLVAVFANAGSAGAERQPPNILLILADDMGFGDLGCMGSKYILTPHIDRLATEGILCRQAYVASSVCSPSRAGLLTGRDPRRFGYESNLNASARNYATRPELLGLPPSERTLGDHLRAAGYATALVGKWHLGTPAPSIYTEGMG